MRTGTRLSMALALMAEKKFPATLAVATVCLIPMLASGVAAKPRHCAKDCKQDIKNCLGLVPPNKSCTGTKVEKKACRKHYAKQRKTCHGLPKLCKQQNPNTSGVCVPSSTTTTSPTSTTIATTTTTTIASPACRFPATGQTTCWDSNGTVIPCTGTGQDGDLKKGAPLSYTDNGDGTITDNNTSLVWEKLSMDGSVHDVSNGYTWDQAFSGHVATLNSVSFAGHNDWRLPNVRELESINDYDRINFENTGLFVSPAFNTGCTAGCTPTSCSCTAADPFFESSFYWSSTTYARNPSHAYDVSARVAPDPKNFETFVVRAVRGGS